MQLPGAHWEHGPCSAPVTTRVYCAERKLAGKGGQGHAALNPDGPVSPKSDEARVQSGSLSSPFSLFLSHRP